MMGCAWCCCYVLCGCVNGASPVRFVLSLFYLCAFQMNPVCVVCLTQHHPHKIKMPNCFTLVTETGVLKIMFC